MTSPHKILKHLTKLTMIIDINIYVKIDPLYQIIKGKNISQ